MIELFQEALAESTLLAYVKYWGQFNDFMINTLGCQIVMPVDTMSVALFVAHLETRGLKASTIRSTMCGLAFAHKVRGLVDPTNTFLIKKLIAAIDRKPKELDPRKPITAPVLLHFLHAWRVITPNWWDYVMYGAAFAMAYHGGLGD